ncbi:hypothetical protein LTR10_023520 [Elasticomyces elasticus]|uniref:Ion transport domain-containing protein n=1 Tax=Exophiala sideris TaxID=1016849 RepID=A0ABR0J188_9EURO|nr:hypothetical protein LTR10_023520 [Elasticomyces elasticus]KAK5023225.1 hypothetical protein LTS07_009447 [Exophiala sideris]KAK5028597.1 hypothetical protein LTR13_009048 [Exophiala sideris]KAK5052975.1 hypothetical protein LTR69_009544 [Exophiala sideris]KAK5178715.1 hypothetical protein LTR44_008829 [Eurotiomycetes sp. CCFEE 6388]
MHHRQQGSSELEHDGIFLEEDEEGSENEEEIIEGEEATQDEGEDLDEDGPDDTTPLLPIFSAAHLDAIPVFALTHAIRTLVTSRCDTVLSWEQLRSPQVTQFLLKPVEQQIRDNHLNAATYYALMANCLQYGKEAAIYSGNSGTNKTRGMVCQLLAIRLLKDYSTRDLIDALSYDFDPLQGHPDSLPADNDGRRGTIASRKQVQRPARISCFEIAIRAQAKQFLSHPTVVQQLEAIWAGTIVFHSAADNLHRKLAIPKEFRSYGTNDMGPPAKAASTPSYDSALLRRAVTLYNPRDASLFKLSRLRVPRYRNILSTMSFAVLLGLFVAVLVERSLEITPLEVFFWFWAAGYMLDEIVGFNEQGFSLYLASFWNIFDLGILLILFIHLALRIYGIVMPDVKKHTLANMAYDVLAADAVLLFPRLFSVLDHYRYFSPLLIGFRYMATDLVAVSLLIVISCSGFFVALTLSFGNEGIDTPSSVAYALLQMVMGFTPAAWDRWPGYNILGKTILTLFLFICHFLVVTILVTVLTNSFTAIVRNANEEHQFLFAVNTISHVKSDALFSYVAPTNILQWVLVPLRYCLPFRQYVKINRTMIKITHFPLLFSIFVYEKSVLQSTTYDSIDLVEHRAPRRAITTKFSRLNRAPSIATFRQDRALEEVFRRPFDSTLRGARQGRDYRHKSSNVVSTWMKDIGDDIGNPPQEQDRVIVDTLESRAAGHRLLPPSRRVRTFSRRTMSVLSDPEGFRMNAELSLAKDTNVIREYTTSPAVEQPSQATDAEADGDDELVTNDEGDEEETTTFDHHSPELGEKPHAAGSVASHEYFDNGPLAGTSTPRSAGAPASLLRTKRDGFASGRNSPSSGSPKHRPRQHSRNVSTATMIFKPMIDTSTDQFSSAAETTDALEQHRASRPGSGTRTPKSKPVSSAAGHRTSKRTTPGPGRMRPVLPGKDDPAFRSAPNLAGLLAVESRSGHPRRRPSLEMDLVSDIGDNRALGGGYVGALPASFAAQMQRGLTESRHSRVQNEEQERFAKIMMARMNSLEEGFREVIHEVRDHMRQEEARSRSPEKASRPATRQRKNKENDTPAPQPLGTGRDKENVDPEEAKDAVGGDVQGKSHGDDVEVEDPSQPARPSSP